MDPAANQTFEGTKGKCQFENDHGTVPKLATGYKRIEEIEENKRVKMRNDLWWCTTVNFTVNLD